MKWVEVSQEREWLIPYYSTSVQFSGSVVSDSLRPHELQHARPPCPSPTPRACSNSCPLSQWCHPTISSSFVPFSSCPQSSPSIRVFPNESVLHIRWPEYWSFSFSISPSDEYSGLISFRVTYMWNLNFGTDAPIYKMETDSQRTSHGYGEGEGLGVWGWQIKTIIVLYIYIWLDIGWLTKKLLLMYNILWWTIMERNIEKKNVYTCVSESLYSIDWHHIVNHTSITKKKNNTGISWHGFPLTKQENSRLWIHDCNR